MTLCSAFRINTFLSVVALWGASGAEPPANLGKRIAEREALSSAAREQYTYRQTLTIEEVPDRRSAKPGIYREVRDVIFLAGGEKTLKLLQTPVNTLQRLKLTEEDFRDIYEVQSGLFTPENLALYEVTPRGEETLDGVGCWVVRVRPKQILFGQRLFEGRFWVDPQDFSILRSEGRAVPQIRSKVPGKENLFPYFTTVREKIGEHWFPVHTHSDDTLDFSSGPIRTRMIIRYRVYKRFQSESKVLP